MNKLLMTAGLAASVGVFFGAAALGDALTDRASDSDVIAQRPVLAATPVSPSDLSLDAEQRTSDPVPAKSLSVAAVVDSEHAKPQPIETSSASASFDSAWPTSAAYGDDERPDVWIPPSAPPPADPDDPASDGSDRESDAGDAPTVEAGVDEIDEPELWRRAGSLARIAPATLRFVDDCAGDVSGEAVTADDEGCPVGMGATIRTIEGDLEPPLELGFGVQAWQAHANPHRCDIVGFDAAGKYHNVIMSNRPASFTVQISPKQHRDEITTVRVETSEAERERWAELGGYVAIDAVNTALSVNTCVTLPDLAFNSDYRVVIAGTDDDGVSATIERFLYTEHDPSAPTPDVQPAKRRPPATFTPLSRDGMAVVSVPYDPLTERVFLGAIPRHGDGASELTCSDIESAVLSGTARLPVNIGRSQIVDVRDPLALPQFTKSVATYFFAEEGTGYEVCTWTAKAGARTFDPPVVTERTSFAVRGPIRWRTRLYLAGGHSTPSLAAGSISIRSTTPYASLSWPERDVEAGAFGLDELIEIADWGPRRPERVTRLEVTGPGGHAHEAVVTTDAECFPAGYDTRPCSPGGVRFLDLPIPNGRDLNSICGSGFGSCGDEGDVSGTLRLLVENYAGPSGPPSMTQPELNEWQVQPGVSFERGAPGPLPATPRFDTNVARLEVLSGYDVVEGVRPTLRAKVIFDRPVQVTATVDRLGEDDCGSVIPPHVSDGFVDGIEVDFPGACWGQVYALGLVATDAAGNVLDTRTRVEGTDTGRAPFPYATTPRLALVNFKHRTTINAMPDDGGLYGIRLNGESLYYNDGQLRCSDRWTNAERSFSGNSFDRQYVSDPWVWTLEVTSGGNGSCGVPGAREVSTLRASLLWSDISAGTATLRFTNDRGVDITIEVYDMYLQPGPP